MDNKILAETIYIKELITEVTPAGIISLVSDGFDFWSVVTSILPKLKETIMSREGTVVIRPDSGDPVKILTGYRVQEVSAYAVQNNSFYVDEDKYDAISWVEGNETFYSQFTCSYWSDGSCSFKISEPLMECEAKGLVECLYDIFGGEKNEQGYISLDSHIGAIYGDSITLERQEQIISRLISKGFVPSVVLGIGSYTYQYVTRDTHGSAMKATDVQKSTGSHIPIFKDPKTDQSKKSAKGLLRVEKEGGDFVLYDQQTEEQEKQGLLAPVFNDGVLVRETSLSEIRELLWSNK